MKRMTPYLRNLILTFNTDTSFPFCDTAATNISYGSSVLLRHSLPDSILSSGILSLRRYQWNPMGRSHPDHALSSCKNRYRYHIPQKRPPISDNRNIRSTHQKCRLFHKLLSSACPILRSPRARIPSKTVTSASCQLYWYSYDSAAHAHPHWPPALFAR